MKHISFPRCFGFTDSRYVQNVVGMEMFTKITKVHTTPPRGSVYYFMSTQQWNRESTGSLRL